MVTCLQNCWAVIVFPNDSKKTHNESKVVGDSPFNRALIIQILIISDVI